MLYGEGQTVMDGLADMHIKVKISQFYGIEINDFAVTVAKTALWIAESQMMARTEEIVGQQFDFLPLTTNASIVEGNALTVDWEEVVPRNELSYIMGNPPFVGQQLRTKEQSKDMSIVFGEGASETKLDYVVCWYKKAIDLLNTIDNAKVKAAFVSTSSICQGESVPTFWKGMFDKGIDLGFAYKPFKWTSESSDIAAVICVIIGFSLGDIWSEKWIIGDKNKIKVDHINAYLLNAPDLWITNRVNTPRNGFPKMIKGSEPSDGKGNLFLTEDERKRLTSKYPLLEKYIKPFLGGDEYLSNKQGQYSRYCFWFVDSNPDDYSHIREIRQRLTNVSNARANSSADRIRKRAEFPYLFCQIRQPLSDYMIFPQHSSGERKYIPIGFVSKDVIVGNACYVIPSSSLYLFGVLMSNVHMAWVKVVCGRLGNGYRYSPAIYNNFPWPIPTAEQKALIEHTAQEILNARAKYPNSSLASLYDERYMPPELRAAHRANDYAVMLAYGFRKDITESECVGELMKMYKEMTEEIS